MKKRKAWGKMGDGGWRGGLRREKGGKLQGVWRKRIRSIRNTEGIAGFLLPKQSKVVLKRPVTFWGGSEVGGEGGKVESNPPNPHPVCVARH